MCFRHEPWTVELTESSGSLAISVNAKCLRYHQSMVCLVGFGQRFPVRRGAAQLEQDGSFCFQDLPSLEGPRTWE